MIRPTPEIVIMLASVARQYPELVNWIAEWRTHELDQLPNAVSNTAIFQGRCQVLSELYRTVKEAPSDSAKLLSGSPSNHAHR